MGLASDIALFTGISLLAAVVLFGTGAVNLPGTNALKDVISQPSVDEDTRYKLESCIDFNGETESLPDPNEQLIFEDSFRHRTFASDTGISLPDLSFLSIAGTADTEIEYVLRSSDGRVVGSGSKFAGEVSSFESVCFETNNLESGTYSVRMGLTGTGFGIFGETGEKSDSVEKSVSVPKLPLGEY